MIKSLYIRIVITFLGIVMFSLLISFFVSKQLYGSRFMTLNEQEMFKAGKQIIAYCTEQQITDVQEYLDSIKTAAAYKLSLYRADQSSIHPNAFVHQQDVEKVLLGGIYRGSAEHADPDIIIGLPFTLGGEPYALFVQSNIRDNFSNYNWVVLSVLLIDLLVGSILILVASRYLVKPINTLTAATKIIAAGDYNVEVEVKNKDELGLLAGSFNHMVKELKQVEQMRRDFVSDVSHEIQSPLTAIRGFSTTLLQDELPESTRKHYLSIIAAESERLSRLSEDLLKLALLESEHPPFSPMSYRMDEQIRQSVIATEPLWSMKKLEFNLSLEELRIEADQDQMAQVWINLITNAIKFTQPEGRIFIDAVRREHTVEVRIRDTGVGMTQEEMEHVFQRFYKADKSRDRSQGGSGLGLSIVQRIVELHQGQIQVLSKRSQGTTFTVILQDHKP